jgi:hypothetical protein
VGEEVRTPAWRRNHFAYPVTERRGMKGRGEQEDKRAMMIASREIKGQKESGYFFGGEYRSDV